MGVNCVCTRYCKNEIIIDSFRMKELEKKNKNDKKYKTNNKNPINISRNTQPRKTRKKI